MADIHNLFVKCFNCESSKSADAPLCPKCGYDHTLRPELNYELLKDLSEHQNTFNETYVNFSREQREYNKFVADKMGRLNALLSFTLWCLVISWTVMIWMAFD